jgi:FlaG/FlaF family flagellin (archaellin)
MVAITVILAAVIAAFVFGMSPPPKAPTVQLRVTATNAAIVFAHNGGDSLILKDEKITITNAVTNSPVDGITGIALANDTIMPNFQTNATIVQTLGAGSIITHTWVNASNNAPAKGDILKVMLQDIPSGQVITQMQVTVT